jgi:GTP-binding protein EngB required for normal cell division
MHEGLIEVLEKTELAVAAARDIVDPDILEELAGIVDSARSRLDYPDEVLVVALAGGTGSGKSSLFNVLTESDAAPVGVLRPTTSEPLAAVPSGTATAFSGHLDRLGIEHRLGTDALGHCLIDLPDTDSVLVDHRHRVESLMPFLDVMIWVVDPEKYRDAALHERYLRDLSGYSAQFLFVLNQIDRIDTAAVEEVTADLARALTEDGVDEGLILPVAASPPVGPPLGIDRLRDRLDGLSRSTLFGKLLVDLSRAATRLADAIGPVVGYRNRVGSVIDDAVTLLTEGQTTAATDALTDFLDTLGGEIGGRVGRRIVEGAVQLPTEVAEVARSLPEPARATWWMRLRGVLPVEPDRVTPARAAVMQLLGPVDDLMASRARALALTTDLSVSVAKALSL